MKYESCNKITAGKNIMIPSKNRYNKDWVSVDELGQTNNDSCS